MTQEQLDALKDDGYCLCRVDTEDETIVGYIKREPDLLRIILSADSVVFIPYHRVFKITVIKEDDTQLDTE